MELKCWRPCFILTCSAFLLIFNISAYLFFNRLLMCKHEEKPCPRCMQRFECKPGDVVHCQCYGIMLNAEERAFIEEKYNDCLCRNCLLELKQRYIFFREKYFINDTR